MKKEIKKHRKNYEKLAKRYGLYELNKYIGNLYLYRDLCIKYGVYAINSDIDEYFEKERITKFKMN